MRAVLERPAKIDSDMWVDEAIWGHRLYDEQTPWLCFMEFLNVLNAEMHAARALKETSPNTLSYSPQQRLYLRNILFNNPRMRVIEREFRNDNHAQWEKWIETMAADSAGIQTPNFSYLQSRFSSFEDFIDVVEFLSSSTIEGENNKRWSSLFIFPFGPDCLYEDLNVKGTNISQDRRFFARTGELLYLMLARSGKGEELLKHFEDRILNNDSKFNRLVSAIQPDEELSHSSSIKREGAYLPYLDLPEYKAIAEDWIRLFKCNIPTYDVIPHLINVMGIHMLIYSLNRAKEVLGQSDKATFLLEIVSPKKTIVRELSADSFYENNLLSRSAVERYIRQVSETNEWQSAINSNELLECRDILKKKFEWPKKSKEDDYDFDSPQELLNALLENAINRHNQHLNKFHNVWSREIGLSSRRGSRRYRYAPQDLLIKSLVLCVVPSRMEFQDFLEELFLKYGFIIGDKQASSYINSGRADQEAFSENASRLEQRLASMGLLKRLSDGCAYVENPFASREELNNE
ncbi:hypothetical protein [Paenibacillus sp. DYY-L-2]|uniref:hypothetical protein n=1 Tax=Paenibacillus sp. DYY-L-2 TaxID=3447013 RepID=UPI003F505D08